jgi:hypothetical protein
VVRWEAASEVVAVVQVLKAVLRLELHLLLRDLHEVLNEMDLLLACSDC